MTLKRSRRLGAVPRSSMFSNRVARFFQREEFLQRIKTLLKNAVFEDEKPARVDFLRDHSTGKIQQA